MGLSRCCRRKSPWTLRAWRAPQADLPTFWTGPSLGSAIQIFFSSGKNTFLNLKLILKYEHVFRKPWEWKQDWANISWKYQTGCALACIVRSLGYLIPLWGKKSLHNVQEGLTGSETGENELLCLMICCMQKWARGERVWWQSCWQFKSWLRHKINTLFLMVKLDGAVMDSFCLPGVFLAPSLSSDLWHSYLHTNVSKYALNVSSLSAL